MGASELQPLRSGRLDHWLSRLKIKINAELMTIEFDDSMLESVYVHGTKVDSVCEFAVGSLLLAVLSKNVILIVKNWIIIHETHVDGKFVVSESLVLPGFSIENLPIVLDLSKKSYDLINVLTGIRNVLINASAKCDYRQHPVIISTPDIGRISIDFPMAEAASPSEISSSQFG